jgi:predicted O-methyltransferase YrrM
MKDSGLEWGSGRSTLWFAGRVAHLTSVEQDPGWYERIGRQMRDTNITNVNLLLCTDDESYVGVADQFPENSLDFALVDGGPRSACANATVKKIRPGGFIAIDDAHRFLPSSSSSPKSRSEEMGARRAPGLESQDGLTWADFLCCVKDWKCTWTSDGVSDTAFWFRPSAGANGN